MKVRRPGLAMCLAASLSVGSAKAAPTTPPAAEALARRFCDVLHTLPAKKRKECCGAEPATLASVCAQELTAALRRGTVALKASAVERCASGTEHLLAGCAWVTPLLPELPPACLGVVTGKLKEGTACHSSLECVDGLYCRGVSAGRPGVCRPPAASRAPCEVPADNLAAFLRAGDDPRHASCRGRCEKGQCLPFVPQGGACASSALCVPGLHCIGGKCENKPLPGIGESCASSGVCASGAYCEAGSCTRVKDAGAVCKLPFECRALACTKTAGAEAGTCADPCTVRAP